MSYYTNPEYFALWSKLMMPANGPPGTEFFIASILIDIIIGIILAGSYSLLAVSIPGEGISKGINYGILLFLIAGVPFTLSMYLLFAVPGSLLVYWAISTLVIYLISGAAFAKIMGGSKVVGAKIGNKEIIKYKNIYVMCQLYIVMCIKNFLRLMSR